MSIKIKGIDALQKKLKQNATMSDVKKIVQTNTAELTQKAQRNAPVDTGYLRRSITMTIEGGGLEGHSTAGAEYGPYVEHGTRFNTAQPFMRPAFNVQKEQFKKDMRELVK